MKFLCGSCRTKYQISDEKVRGKILTIRCKKCGSKILVRESLARETGGKTAVAPVADEQRTEVEVEGRRSASGQGGAALAHAYDSAMQGPGSGRGEADDMPTSIAPVPSNLDIAGVEWYVAIDGEQLGPFAFAEVIRKVTVGEVIGRHYVWHDGMDGWSRVRDVEDLAGYLDSAKKRPPPPPPPSSADHDGNVVDFASKRAQRQQALGANAVAPMDADLDQTEVETPGDAPLAGASDRAEQLDDVLNEALGIEGEGRTAQAAADAAASEDVAGPVAVAGTATGVEEMLAFDDHQEDIFANVPRASDEADVQRESTRFFVAAAGVNRQKSRRKMGLLIGLVALLCLGGFVVAMATGVIEIHLPGVGNPFAKADTDEDDGALALDDIDPDSVEDPEALKKTLAGIKDPKKRAAVIRRQQRQRRRKPAAASPEVPVGGDYVDDGTKGARGTRGTRGAGAAEGIGDVDVLGGSKGVGDLELADPELPSSGVSDLPPVDTGYLDSATVSRVVNARKKSVSICYEQSLRGREDLRGKLELEVTVEPEGRVSRVSVVTVSFKGSKLARCIGDKIKDWRFPRFNGEPQQIVVPFVLEKHSY